MMRTVVEPKQYLQKIKRRPATTALVFALFLTVAEGIVFRQDYVGFWRTLAERSALEQWRDLFYVWLSFAALFFFVRSTLVSRFGWQCVYFAVFALALAVEYGFHEALGRFTLPSDLENTVYASDASDKFGAVALFFSWLVVVPLVAYRGLFWFSPTDATGGAKLFAVNLLILFGGFWLVADFERRSLPTNAFAAHFDNLTVSALYFGELKFAAKGRRAVVPPLADRSPRNNVVFIVDESVRADHLSVNGYERQTTPTLESLERANLLTNWGVASSGATESVHSNRLLLGGVSDLPDRENQLATLPTIFQYARAAGYQTFYFDGQDYAAWIGDENDRCDFGRIFTSRDFPHAAPHDLDRQFAHKIREIVGGSGGNFIWVNKRGVHFRYEKNYPATAEVWTPIDSAATELDADRSLENNYDNAVLYNSESFFQTLVGDRLPAETVFVYTSDHGQTLRNGRATHAGDSKAEALVPIFIIGADERLRRADTDFPAAHRNLYATLLDLIDFPKELRAHRYALSLLEATKHDAAARTYFVGNLTGAFDGKKMAFDDTERRETADE